MIALALALIIPTAPAQGEVGETMSLMSRAIGECIRDNALRLEPSGEPAATIADSAVTACGHHDEDALYVIAMWANIDRGLDAEGSVRVARSGLASWKQGYREQAILSVTEARAARAAR